MQRKLGMTLLILVMRVHFLMRIRCLLGCCLLMRSGESKRGRGSKMHVSGSEVFRQEVDLTIDHGPLSDSEIYSLRAFLAYLFGEFLFVDQSKGRAHLSVVRATGQLDYLEQVAWGLVIMSELHYHVCSVARGARFLGGCSIFLQVWAWEHITIPHPLPSQLAPSFPTIHCWSYGVWDSGRIPSRLYYSLFLDTQAVGEINWTPMRVEPVPAIYVSYSQAFKMTDHLICMFLVMPTFPGRVRCQLGLPQTTFEITPP
ncbi:hypothetical protein AMTR_s00020p00202690 [Amborella trichopoda]|uniref:Aminotransferase-like plant mobile domain-containing protein n=1 Tax=Amborella trichopoda TaxID=13333 RepID=W1PWX5_AMBTC|nr:hypothetical protein AMTR_s00020p00202690 [Amborella trichopoda]